TCLRIIFVIPVTTVLNCEFRVILSNKILHLCPYEFNKVELSIIIINMEPLPLGTFKVFITSSHYTASLKNLRFTLFLQKSYEPTVDYYEYEDKYQLDSKFRHFLDLDRVDLEHIASKNLDQIHQV
ncbi:hypothetical protein L9F63_016101, partial [Diploptera punctata]